MVNLQTIFYIIYIQYVPCLRLRSIRCVTVYIMTGGRPAAVVESCKGSTKDSGVEKNGEPRAKPNVYVDCTDII